MRGVIGWILIGAVAGYLARFLLPGRDPMGCIGTVLLGILGSFVGGTLGSLIFEGELALNAAGLLGSIVGALIVLVLLRRARR